jgi:hypothetical protein
VDASGFGGQGGLFSAQTRYPSPVLLK